MSGVTGIELGPNYCVLVRGGRAGSQQTVSAASTLLLSASGDRQSRVHRLREARERGDFPSRARVVAWGSGSATAPNDIAALAALAEAGFEIGLVLSPAQALGRMVRARSTYASTGTAVAALSLNNHGAAIAIVAGAEVICSRVFEWPLGAPFEGERSALLDRYLLVSQLAPQLQHVIDLVRPVNGVTVTSVLVSGNLPDLRSLAMLLIEEMDIEVETLDSAELLEPGAADAFGEVGRVVAAGGSRRIVGRASGTGAPPGRPGSRLGSGARRASGETCLAMAPASEPRSARRARVLVGVVVHAGRQLLTGAAHFSRRHRTGPGCRCEARGARA